MAGSVKRVVMGLDRMQLTPCGFCFVEYDSREEAENAMYYINGTKLDDRIIRLDWDIGFSEGRQYGRGKSGGQVLLKLFFSIEGVWPGPAIFMLLAPTCICRDLKHPTCTCR